MIAIPPVLTVQLYVKWWNVWVGIFYDVERQILYFQLIPFVGLRFYWAGVHRPCLECALRRGHTVLHEVDPSKERVT